MSKRIARQKFMPSSKLLISTKPPPRVLSRKLQLRRVTSIFGGYRASVAFRKVKGGFKIPRYQNTYQMESSNPFSYLVVDKILKNVMKTYFTSIKIYDPAVCLKVCQDMTSEIRKQIFKKNFVRYKYIVSMSIIEKLRQGVDVTLGSLLDTEKDTYRYYVSENKQFYAIGIIAGFYYE